MTKDKPPEGPKTIEIIKGSKEHLEYIFKLLASNLNDNDYSHVVAVMQMIFVGHSFYCTPDGFELVNMSIKAKQYAKKNKIKSKIKARQGNVISINLNK
jgi:hypothetical protein